MFRKVSLVMVAAVALSGCLSQSQIQGKYVKAQNQCRTESSKALVGNDQSAVGAAFSECMNKAGWHVSSPKTSVVTNNPPSGSPSTNPIASAAKTVPVENTAAANPPSGAPSVKPSAAVGAVTVPAPAANVPAGATYQPARPISSGAAPGYGGGAGRQF
jgi:hypothetical protein